MEAKSLVRKSHSPNEGAEKRANEKKQFFKVKKIPLDANPSLAENVKNILLLYGARKIETDVNGF